MSGTYGTESLLTDASKVFKIAQLFEALLGKYKPVTGVTVSAAGSASPRYAQDVLVWGKTSGGLFAPLHIAADGTLQVQDVAAGAVLGDMATEETLGEVFAALAPLATQTTLASVLAGIGAVADAAVTDPTASATLVKLLKGLLKQLQGTGSGAAPVIVTGSSGFIAGKPCIVDQDCIVAATNYDIDVNAALGRNAHYGFLKSKSTNTGVVSVAISSDGATFTSFIPDIQRGDSIDLDGMDIDTIRVKSTVAGDDVIMEVH